MSKDKMYTIQNVYMAKIKNPICIEYKMYNSKMSRVTYPVVSQAQ